MAQSPRSRNPDYQVHIANNTAGIFIKADLPEEVGWGIQNSFQQAGKIPFLPGSDKWDSLKGNMRDLLGIGIVLKEMTKQIWSGTTPIGMTLPLQFDAEVSAREDVAAAAKSLLTLAAPYQLGSGLFSILYSPNPTRLSDTANVTSIQIGRQIFFDSVAIESVNYRAEQRISRDGFPISGQVDLAFVTDYVWSRDDIQSKMFG